ncbi:hypothetical protein KIPB_016734, partial [Kipferlia bialata]|eukprot:g16734.t1
MYAYIYTFIYIYPPDFATHKRVEVTRAPVVTFGDDITATVNCELTATVKPSSVTSLDVDY